MAGILRQFDRGYQTVVEVPELSLQQQRHAAVGQRRQYAAEDPAVQDQRQHHRDHQQHHGAGLARHFAGPGQDRQVVQCQPDPKRQAEPDQSQGKALQPDVGPDAPAQSGQHGFDSWVQIVMWVNHKRVKPIGSSVGASIRTPRRHRSIPSTTPSIAGRNPGRVFQPGN